MNRICNLSTFIFLTIYSMFIFVTSCKTDEPNNAGTVKDKDGNTYHTVKIGTQVWMVENLKTTKYNDGTTIPTVTDNTDWATLTIGACCNYNNDAANGTQYGKLYNWYAVNTGKLAPKGWHVPTDAEWTILEYYLKANGYNYDGTTTGNKYAKSLAATSNWIALSEDTGVIGYDLSKNNKTGFTALPGGARNADDNLDGTFKYIGQIGGWWSTTENGTKFGLGRAMYSRYSYVYSGDEFNKTFGFSVRCVKD